MIIELQKEEKTYKIKSDFCLLCGKKFSKNERLKDLHKSKHHSIPNRLKPLYNVIVPLHNSCHRRINAQFIIRQEFIKIKDKVESLKASFNRIEKGVI